MGRRANQGFHREDGHLRVVRDLTVAEVAHAGRAVDLANLIEPHELDRSAESVAYRATEKASRDPRSNVGIGRPHPFRSAAYRFAATRRAALGRDERRSRMRAEI